MKQFFITGTSSGIGRALALKALKDGHKVMGFSRRSAIEHPGYRHVHVNLADYNNYHLLNFAVNHEADEMVLINNAGWLGEVKPLAQIAPESIEKAFQINLIAPSILSKLFLEQTSRHQKRTIINISSGAGRYPVSSWSTYCASKSGLDMLTRVTRLDYPDVQAYAIEPGIVDTAMQGEIRQLLQEDFPDRERFVNYKKNGDLSDPDEVASKILSVVYDPEKAPDYVFSVRDL